jgi:hypothetical protein
MSGSSAWTRSLPNSRIVRRAKQTVFRGVCCPSGGLAAAVQTERGERATQECERGRLGGPEGRAGGMTTESPEKPVAVKSPKFKVAL